VAESVAEPAPALARARPTAPDGRGAAAYAAATARRIEGCPNRLPAPARAGRPPLLFPPEEAPHEVGHEPADRPDRLAIPMIGVPMLLDRHIEASRAAAAAAAVRRAHDMPFGAAVRPDGTTRFRLWAPAEERVRLALEGGADEAPLAMAPAGDGWHELVTDRAAPGARYRFELGDGARVPDPASRHQPEDVHGPSEVVDPRAYAWADGGWRGRPWHEAVLYELHVGTFTPEGTFRAAIGRLDHLAGLGVTAIELMPVADFPGRRNWGYDGVLLYAPDSAYGRPEDLKALVDAAHARGLMVFLDVVYNHFGPDGNYFSDYAPLFTDRHRTPWGAAIDYDGARSGPVREFMVHNALYWLEEFHFDGLRLDAVHAIVDDGPRHLLAELAERVRSRLGPTGRRVHLVLENDANQARWLARDPEGRARWYEAQWADDLHHGLHVAATGESAGYYADYHGDLGRLGRALAEGFAYQGDPSAFKGGEPRGEPSGHLPPTAFVGFLQNHDQVGNRAFGDRIAALAPAEAVRAVAALYLLSPAVPMLFMGEEWGSDQPFPFFCDFGPELAEAVRKGRREEFAGFPEFGDPASRERIPDPTAPGTFEGARLDWAAPGREPHAGWLGWYREVLRARRERIVPLVPDIAGGAGSYEVLGPAVLRVSWRLPGGRALTVRANLSAEPAGGEGLRVPEGEVVWREGGGGEGGVAPSARLGPWEVVWWLAGPGALDRPAERAVVEAG
jgi:malto-oligosyltrehalose trehalohydrolase